MSYPPGMSQRDLAHFDQPDIDDLLSDCCGAPMNGSDEDYICSECKEHCEPHHNDEGDWI